jgi:hypothetical protein
MIASAKNNADENENTVRQTSAPIVLIGGAVRVMSSHLFHCRSRRHAVDAMSVLDGGN